MNYEPLDLSNFETRLLDISPQASTDDSTFSCSIVHTSLATPPRYTALSYCWGDRNVTAPIFVNGNAVQVTTNLESALRQLRKSGRKLVWCDALCINQNDNLEKAIQVSRMGQVYARAYLVICWLGPSTCEDDEAFIRHCRQTASRTRRSSDGQSRQSTLAARERLIDQPYWKRAWVTQEIAKAGEAHVQWGAEQIPWEDLWYAINENSPLDGSAYRPHPVRTSPNMLSLATIDEFRVRERRAQFGDTRMFLYEAMVKTLHTEACNPRDKAYSLISMVNDAMDVVAVPNYTQTDAEVFNEINAHMAGVQGFKQCAILARFTERPDTWPTWSPNWGKHRCARPPWVQRMLQANLTRYALKSRYARDPKVLHLEGKILSTVMSALKDPLTPPRDYSDTLTVKVPSTGGLSRDVWLVNSLIRSLDNVLWCAKYESDLIARPRACRLNDSIPPIVRVLIEGTFPFSSHWKEMYSHLLIEGESLDTLFRRFLDTNAEEANRHVSGDVLRFFDEGLQILHKYHMRLIVDGLNEFRAVPDSTQVGDQIFRIRSWPLAAVLRPTTAGFHFVGESLKMVQSKGSNASTTGLRHIHQYHTAWEDLAIH